MKNQIKIFKMQNEFLLDELFKNHLFEVENQKLYRASSKFIEENQRLREKIVKFT